MCPDKQFISIYFDGELPSPWKERMEQHLETCSECGKTLESYKKTSKLLNNTEDAAGGSGYDAAMEAARIRVWEKLDSIAAEPCIRRYPLRFAPRIPSAAFAAIAGAAAAAVIICFMLLIAPNKGTAVSSDYDLNIPDIMPVSNMSDIMSYLESNESSNFVIIKLPERKKFKRYGDPDFIRSAEYNRRKN
ncbi:MAG: zf-HC2 domain-containing protein [Spirochaetaceae bacterium]|jgi:hypothetical protein|nr:zf-HC2 domain-containing protein [Spirochaetaceae bacterium]